MEPKHVHFSKNGRMVDDVHNIWQWIVKGTRRDLYIHIPLLRAACCFCPRSPTLRHQTLSLLLGTLSPRCRGFFTRTTGANAPKGSCKRGVNHRAQRACGERMIGRDTGKRGQEVYTRRIQQALSRNRGEYSTDDPHNAIDVFLTATTRKLRTI